MSRQTQEERGDQNNESRYYQGALSKAKTPLSYQETAEDEKTARNRAILTGELKEKQTRQRAEDERLRLLQQPQEKDEIRKIAEAREDQQRIKKEKEGRGST